MFKPKIINNTIPKHVAIVMDGNGRWARRRGLPRTAGHAAGAKTFQKIARYGNKIGLKYMTVYAFSTENWKRPVEEVESLMKLFKNYLESASNYKDENIKVKFIGDLSKLTSDLKELIDKAEDGSKNATGMQLNIAVNYGGRDELVNAMRDIYANLHAKNAEPQDINEELITKHLYTANIPEPDLIIRPSGEYRTSNFLLWQSAYSEYWFSDILWPDFKTKHLDLAIYEYNSRDRRFGKVK